MSLNKENDVITEAYESASEEETSDTESDEEFANATCFRCKEKVNECTVVYCSDGRDSWYRCAIMYCAACHDKGTDDCPDCEGKDE